MIARTVDLKMFGRTAHVTVKGSLPGNLINESVAFSLREICRSVAEDPSIWVVVVTGVGDTFCKGTEFSGNLDHLRVSSAIAAIQKPVIAAINGDAIDQGLELALACDIRIATPQAILGFTHLKRALMPWDGGTQRLPRIIGLGRAMDFVLRSRLLEARKCLEMDLVNELVESCGLMERSLVLASAIAKHGPIATRYVKEALMKGMDMTLEQGLRLETDLNILLQSTVDRVEGINSFLEHRTPEYDN